MFEPLFARLSDRYHLVAPDYPGFGHSDWPDPKQFDCTFDHIASVMDDLRRRGDRIAVLFVAVHSVAIGTKQTCQLCLSMSAFGGKADIG